VGVQSLHVCVCTCKYTKPRGVLEGMLPQEFFFCILDSLRLLLVHFQVP